MTMLILKILLALLLVQALVKFGFFFLLSYATRRKMLDAQYADKPTATKTTDLLLLGLVLLLLGLLFASGRVETVSLAVGLYAGMTLIQTYFHQFSKPLPPTEAPPPLVSPIKMMSYAIQANPEKPWKELLVITVLFLWVLYQLATEAFGLV